jgi:hypothetical protein
LAGSFIFWGENEGLGIKKFPMKSVFVLVCRVAKRKWRFHELGMGVLSFAPLKIQCQ